MKGYQNNFGHSTAFIKRLLNWLKGEKGKKTRRRDNCPEWVKQAALDKAHEKRAMRAEKRLAMVNAGAMQMVEIPKKKKRRWFK